MGIDKWAGLRPLPGDIQDKLGQLPDLLAANEVQLAYLFGSLVAGQHGHDVDLALLMAGDHKPYRLRDQIIDCLGTERVDIVDLQRAAPVLRFEIVSSGRCLHSRDPDLPLAFALATVRLYQDTNYLRQVQNEILQERMEQYRVNES